MPCFSAWSPAIVCPELSVNDIAVFCCVVPCDVCPKVFVVAAWSPAIFALKCLLLTLPWFAPWSPTVSAPDCWPCFAARFPAFLFPCAADVTLFCCLVSSRRGSGRPKPSTGRAEDLKAAGHQDRTADGLARKRVTVPAHAACTHARRSACTNIWAQARRL